MKMSKQSIGHSFKTSKLVNLRIIGNLVLKLACSMVKMDDRIYWGRDRATKIHRFTFVLFVNRNAERSS